MHTSLEEAALSVLEPKDSPWLVAEQQIEDVLRGVRLLNCNLHQTTAPLLSTFATLTQQTLSVEERRKLGLLLARALGTMLYAVEFATETERMASMFLQQVEEGEEAAELLPLRAALAVFYYQTGTRRDSQYAFTASALQAVTAALETAESKNAAGGTDPDGNFLLLLVGCLHYVSGRLDRVLELYERYGYRVSRNFSLWHDLFSMYTSHAALYCWRFPMSLGIVESCRNTSEITGSSRQSLIWRVHLSFLLLRMERMQEALLHIDHVLTVAAETGWRQISSVCSRALALYHYKNGNAEAAARVLFESGKMLGDTHNPVGAVTDSVVLGMLFNLQVRQGFSLPMYAIEQELQRLEQGPNAFLRGVGLCLRGQLAREQGDASVAVHLLRRGFQELLHSGSLGECVRAGQELMQSLEDAGLQEERHRLQERLARMREALPAEPACGEAENSGAEAANLWRCLASLANISQDGTVAENLSRLVEALRRELSAQRVVLLRGTPCGGFEYAAGSNLTSVEARSKGFRKIVHPLQALCQQATPEYPVLWRRHEHGADMSVGLALFVSGSMPWLLYMDNSLGSGAFMSLSQETARPFCATVAAEIRGILRVEAPRVQHVYAGTTRVEPHDRAERMPPLFGEGLRSVLDDAERAAETSASVLILGETGVGKEILARYIHERSGCSGPFVPVHLACISEHLFESELFGHEKGAFTGAVRAKTGLVELARNGVLFLDEVGDIPLPFQVKLLRFLQEREFMRVGGVQNIRTNFRLITATNRNLQEAIKKGLFREDLYHRLAVIPLHIPSLRERKNDIVPLARAFRRYYAEMHCRSGQFPTDTQLAALRDEPWPGNIRELQGVLERAVVLERWQHNSPAASFSDKEAAASQPRQSLADELMSDFPQAEELLQSYIRLVLDKTGGKIYGSDGAAAILGMNKSTLYARMKKMGMR